MRDAIARWTHGEPWRTWVAHAVIALFDTLVTTVTLGWFIGWETALLIGAAVSVGFYARRELDQMFYAVVDKKPHTAFDAFDRVMDVAAPAAAVGVVVLVAVLL